MDTNDSRPIDAADDANDVIAETGSNELHSTDVSAAEKDVPTGSGAGRRGFGLRGRLMLAFGVVAAAGLVSAGVALVQFGSIQTSLDKVTKQSLPAITAAEDIAAESALLAAAAPVLDGARNQSDREKTILTLEERFEQLFGNVEKLSKLGVDSAQVEAIELQSHQMLDSIEEQNEFVRQRLDAAKAREDAVSKLGNAHQKLLNTLTPLIADTDNAFSAASAKVMVTAEKGIKDLADEGVGTLVQLYEVQESVGRLARAINDGANAANVEEIEEAWRGAVPQSSRLHTAIAKLDKNPDMETLVALSRDVIGVTIGDKSIYEQRKEIVGPDGGGIGAIQAAGEVDRMVGLTDSLEEKIQNAITPLLRRAQVGIKLAGIELQNGTDEAMRGLIDVQLPHYRTYLELAAKANRLAGLIATAATAPNAFTLVQTQRDLGQETGHLQITALNLDEDQAELKAMVKELVAFAEGPDSLAAIRQAELDAITASADKLTATRQKAEELGATVVSLVGSAKADGEASAIAADKALEQTRTWLIAAAAIGLLVALGCALVYVPRRITNRLIRLGNSMQAIANGDLEAEIPTGGRDEISGMADALVVFRDNAREIDAANARTIEERQRAAEERRSAQLELAASFEASVQSVVDNVAKSASGMHNSANQMSGLAGTTSEQIREVAGVSEEVANNVQVVASTAEELASSITEISRQVSESSNIAHGAVEEAEQTNQSVRSLVDASSKIGEVVGLIQSIAEQTNLLALNATIEAARAGDAGRGFAVVAGEVKELASQTAKATEEISDQIGRMQQATTSAVSAIDGIVRTIGKINDIAGAIAAAVEEQGAATSEIARSAQQLSSGTATVSTNVSNVAQAAGETGSVAGQVLESAGHMAQEAERLNDEVNRFLNQVRAA